MEITFAKLVACSRQYVVSRVTRSESVNLLERLRENSYRHLTFGADGQRLWDRAVKFARWQHRALCCRANFAANNSTCLYHGQISSVLFLSSVGTLVQYI